MPRRTREQKIIADLRRELQRNQPNRPAVTKPSPKVETIISLPTAPAVTESVTTESPAPSYLRDDLLRVGVVVSVAAALELFVSYFVSSGMFKSLGIS